MKNKVLRVIITLKRQRGEPIWLDEVLEAYIDTYHQPLNEEVLKTLDTLEREGYIYTKKNGWIIYTTKKAYTLSAFL